MPICKQCNTKFPNRTFLNGKEITLHRRVYCLNCSPFGKRSKCGPISKLGVKMKGHSVHVKCKECSKTFVTKNASHTCYACKSKNTRAKRKLFALNYKGGKCAKCGYNRCHKALVFHHIDPEDKLMQLSWNWDKSFERVKEELDKCCLLCAICHIELHDGMWNIEELK